MTDNMFEYYEIAKAIDKTILKSRVSNCVKCGRKLGEGLILCIRCNDIFEKYELEDDDMYDRAISCDDYNEFKLKTMIGRLENEGNY